MYGPGRALFLLLLLFLFGAPDSCAQSGLLLQHRTKSGRVVPIKLNRNYAIRTEGLGNWRGRITSHKELDLLLLTHDEKPITLPLSAITEIERGNFYAGAGAICMFATAFCLVGAPIAWALEGGDRALAYLAGAGLGAVLFVPFHLLSERFRYDLVHQWHWRVMTPAPLR